MGGSIGQRLAISHADRVASLTSISSSGYAPDPAIPNNMRAFGFKLLKLWLRHGVISSDRSSLKMRVGTNDLSRGDGEPAIDLRRAAESALYESRERRGSNGAATFQHIAAVEASGSRYEELGAITAPTLVIHGRVDPILPVIHAETYAPMIPGAELLLIDDLGHLLPADHTPTMIDAMLRLFSAAESGG